MHFNSFQLTLWLFPAVLETVIVVVMLYREYWRTLPVFLTFLIFAILRTCFLFSQRHYDTMYFFSYWISEAVANLAHLLAIKELFNQAYEHRLGLRKLGNTLFRWSIAFLLIVATFVAWHSPGGDVYKLMAGIWVIRRTVAIVEAGLLLLLAVYVFLTGVPVGNYVFGILVGFAIFGGADVFATTFRAVAGQRATPFITWIIMLANNVSVLIWAASIFVPERKQIETTVTAEELSHNLAAMAQAIRRLEDEKEHVETKSS